MSEICRFQKKLVGNMSVPGNRTFEKAYWALIGLKIENSGDRPFSKNLLSQKYVVNMSITMH